MQYFVRAKEMQKDNLKGPRAKASAVPPKLYPDVEFSALGVAVNEAKRAVLESDRAVMLQAEACFRNRNLVRTKYRCWIDERGAFNESAFI
jgi:hypothetical protein